jgi:hypothetical protein
MGNNMAYVSLSPLVTTLAVCLSVSACQGQSLGKKDTGGVTKDDVSSTSDMLLPAYGGVTLLEASISGRISITGQCVYLVDTDGNQTIIVFPKDSRLGDDGASIVTLNKTVRDGEQVSFSGSPTTRTFWKSLAPDVPYQPIPKDCKGDSVWLAGQMIKG